VSWAYVNLDESFPEDGVYHPNTHLWSSVKSDECPTHVMENTDLAHEPNKIMGTTLAHYRVWQEFYRRYQDSPEQRIIIFEGDAECAVPYCGDKAISQMKQSKEDVMWLGWCWYTGAGPPFCLVRLAICSFMLTSLALMYI